MLCIKNLSTLEMGRQGENIARSVQISVQEWYEEFGDNINITLVVQRPTEDYGYFPEITIENGILNWVITNTDTSFDGTGHAELVATDSNGLNVKSKIFKTLIYESLATGESPVVPPPTPSWIDLLLELAYELDDKLRQVEEELDEVEQDIEDIQEDIEFIEQFVDEIEEIEQKLEHAVIESTEESDVKIIYCGSASELITNP